MTSAAREPRLLGERLTLRWAHAYTRHLDPVVANDRRDEIAADLYDHLADATTAGDSAWAVSRSMTTRMLLGVPADLSWRSEQGRAHKPARRREIAMTAAANTPFRMTALALGAVTVGWGAVISTGAALEETQGIDTMWVLFTIATVVGLVGLILLARRRSVGAALLTAPALATTVAFYWAVPLVLAGLALFGFFVMVAMRGRSASASETVATSAP